MWRIEASNLTQTFNQRDVFRDISFAVRSGESLVVTGPNGSGKTTLVRIICNLLRPTAGTMRFCNENGTVNPKQLYSAIGLVGPYLQLYNNLTALENYSFFAKIRDLPVDLDHFKSLMRRMGLAGRELEELRTYSSGMLQRMKYVCALIHQPEVLVLDEPTSNLDTKGSEIVYQIMEEQKRDKILILATNEPGELRFGDRKIQLAA